MTPSREELLSELSMEQAEHVMALHDSYDPAANAKACYDLAIKAGREKGIRAGTLEPFTDVERQWAAEGPLEPAKLEAVQPWVRKEVIGQAVLYQGDCVAVMPVLPRMDACVTDPPYGIGEAAGKNASRGNLAIAKDYGKDTWDDKPVAAEVLQLIRDRSDWQIVFGGNYYSFPASPCWLVWDKKNGSNDFADCELAWTNLPKAVRRIEWMWNGMLRKGGEARGFHPTQKPVGVMQWCLQQLPAGVETIMDPFMGSGTTGIACVREGKRFVGIEREAKYFETACERIRKAYEQPDMLIEAAAQPVQGPLFPEAAA